MSQKLTSMCGIDCNECGAYKASRDDDNAARMQIAEEWSKMYGTNLLPADINCTGCRSEGAKFQYCSMCEIRSCGEEHQLDSCAFCPDYGCERLESFFKVAPAARDNLDHIRSLRN